MEALHTEAPHEALLPTTIPYRFDRPAAAFPTSRHWLTATNRIPLTVLLLLLLLLLLFWLFWLLFLLTVPFPYSDYSAAAVLTDCYRPTVTDRLPSTVCRYWDFCYQKFCRRMSYCLPTVTEFFYWVFYCRPFCFTLLRWLSAFITVTIAVTIAVTITIIVTVTVTVITTTIAISLV